MYNHLGIWQSALPDADGKGTSKPSKLLRRIPGAGEVLETGTYLSIPLEMIPTDLALPCSLYVRISEKFVLFRKVGDVLTQARSETLVGPSNGILYVNLEEWNKLLHSLEAVLVASEKAATTEPALDRGLRIRNLLVAYARHVEQAGSFSSGVLTRIRTLGDQLAEIIYYKPTLGQQLLRRYQDPALYYVNHVVNVAIYAIAIGKKKQLDLPTAKALAFAALVHNVGNVMIPANLLYKPGELTVDEKNRIDTHILHGATLLQSFNAPKEVILTAMQHHDRYDGEGLTGRRGGETIHLFARICCIADVYDAITSHRPYHMSPLSGEAAVRRMSEMKGKFDPNIIPMVASGDSDEEE